MVWWLFCAYAVDFMEFYRIPALLFVGFLQDLSLGVNGILWKKLQEIMVESRYSLWNSLP